MHLHFWPLFLTLFAFGGSLLAVLPAAAQEAIASVTTSFEAEDEEDKEREFARGRQVARRVTPQGEWRALENEPMTMAQASPGTAQTEPVIVRGFDVTPPPYAALPEVEGTRINSGKKTSFVKPNEEFPTIANNQYREALATTPGLLVSEEPSSPIVNIGYRGLDSQRIEFGQSLKDGVSIKNEQFGFPETHYTPVLDSLERIEFIRAGAALQFGPQPGGALNFVTKMPQRDAPFHFLTKNLFGSDELFTSYTSVDGTIGRFGYYGYYDHREREGFRENSDYDLDSGSLKLVYDVTNDSRFILTLDAYDEEHGEPGGLTEVPAPGASLYQVDRNVTTRFFDRFRLRRFFAELDYQQIVSANTQFEVKAYGGYLSRFSRRQRGGGFGVAPNPNPAPGSAASTNSIQDRQVWSEGAELRVRHDYQLAGDTSTFTGGLYFYHASQDRDDERGVTRDADAGVQRNFVVGETWDGSIFAENRFHFGRLSLTPGFRLEFLQQDLDEEFNITRPANLLTRSDFNFVPLFSLGAGYVLVESLPTTTQGPMGKGADPKEMKNVVTTLGPPRAELYATVAQAYRPRTYGELVPTSATGVVNGDLEEGDSIQFELGIRGKPLPYLTYDVGGFYFTFDDQVGDIVLPGGFTSTGNVGDSRYVGFEAAAELDVLALINGGAESPWGKFNLYGNVTLLDAEYTRGPNDGNDTVYAPDYQLKFGGIYRWKDAVKVGLLATMVDDTFATADNAPERFIPAYTVVDLTAEVNFWDGRLGVFGGIGNLLDEDYYGEIRDEGIVPAYRRNYYGGIKVRF